MPDSSDLRSGVTGPEWNVRGANLARAGPIRDAVHADDDPAEGIRRARTPRGQSIPGHVDGAEQLRSLHAMKILRQGFALVDDADRDVGLTVGQICQFAERQDIHLDIGMQTREIGEIRHQQMCRHRRRQRHPQTPAHALIAPEHARLQLV